MKSVEKAPRERLDTKVREHREPVLKHVGERGGDTVAGLVLSADELLERAQRIDVSDAVFRRFVDALDAPAEEIPTLRRYARVQSAIPTP
jgi:uncharacterized protein (DUF1778 family)